MNDEKHGAAVSKVSENPKRGLGDAGFTYRGSLGPRNPNAMLAHPHLRQRYLVPRHRGSLGLP